MDVVETENSNDSTDKIKEKVRVVSLEDPSIIASEFAGNSNSSVWSLCGLNSDDHDVDLGDISPSISPIFTEQQMADHLRERLMNEDHIFTGEHASETRLNDNSRPSSDLQSHLELFKREMKSLESDDSGDECKLKKEGDLPRDGGHLATKIPGKSSPRKRGVTTSAEQEAGIALRTRNRRTKQAGGVKVDPDSEKNYNKIESKDKENLGKGNGMDEKSERADEKPETVNQTDQIKLDQSDKGTAEGSISNSFAEDMESQTSGDAGVNIAKPGTQANSPNKRVTRSTTGNLKPKQQFDEIQEKEEMKHNKMKEGKAKQIGKKGKNSDGGENKDDDKDKSTKEGKKGKDDGVLSEKGSNDKESGDESLSDGDEVDFHEDDSDYSPEDDPDRPWCICRKPHGNKFMICCDGCEEWFHGKCVGITMEKGRVMERQGKEYVCDKCKEKKMKELLMAEKAREFAETIKIKPDTTTQEEPKKPRPKRRFSSNNVVEPDSSEKPTQDSSPSQSDEVKKKRVKDPPGFKIPKKVRTTPTPVSHSTVQAPKKCIVEGCPKTSFEGAVYCGRSCIERHVSEAVKMLTSKEHGGKLHTSEGNRVSMIEKSSGRLVAGMAAPVVTNLTDWILKNPSFQVLVSGTSPTTQPSSSFYNKVNAESKQKKEIDKKSEEETVRSNVRRMMKDILVERKKESSDIRISVEEIMKLVRKIEEDMYKAFKDTSHRYKAKYRTLMFNLRDPRNKVLYRRVLTGDINPDKLIWMTSDELATKELAQWREQETKHMIDMIRKEEENTNKARFIKKTHKGEVDMGDDEDLSTLEATNIKEVQEKKPKVEEKVETPVTDTTEEHRAHLFDLNCKICTGKMAPPGEIAGKSPSMSNVPIQAAAESSIPSPPPVQEPSTYTEPLSPDSRSTTPDFSNATSKAKETSVWKGFVMMQNVAKFGTNAFLVSGSGDNLIQVLPDTLHVHGRIAHKHVWDYVKQCKTSSSRELCIIRFAAASDEEKISYVSLYSYFHSRKRCGVIGNCYSGVKDMYLVPLASHEPIPSHLLPFSGPGLQEPRPHMLLGLIVKNKSIPAKRSRSGSDRVSSKTQSIEPPTKRTSIDDPSPKSSTSSSQPTTAKPSDSPVDEIEDIVFHYHNSQGTKPESKPAQPAKPTQPASIPPMISALLKIQEQEKKLRELQKQSELLEKELAPINSVGTPVGLGQSSAVSGQGADLMPTASNHLPEEIPKMAAGPAKSSNTTAYPPGAGFSPAVPFLSVDGPQRGNIYPIEGTSNIPQSVASQQVTKANDADNEPYDPETANNEEAPYDPEDMDTMDLGLDETSSPEKCAAVLTQPPTSLDNLAVASQIASTIVKQTLAGSTVAGSLQQSILSNTIGKPQAESLVKTLVEHVKKQPNATSEISLKSSEQNITQRSIPKELEEKVQSLLKPEHSGLAKQTDKKSGIPSNNLGESGADRRDPGPGVYHHTRDFPEKRDFPERREFLERRGPSYNDGRDDPKFYSSRFSLRHGGDERGGHNRGGGHVRGGGSHRPGYDRDYRSRDDREDERHWDDRGDGRRRNDHFHRNRDRYQRDRNWRR